MPPGRPGSPGGPAPFLGNLHAYNVSGCTGLITSGSPIPLSASYTITPPQTITNS